MRRDRAPGRLVPQAKNARRPGVKAGHVTGGAAFAPAASGKPCSHLRARLAEAMPLHIVSRFGHQVPPKHGAGGGSWPERGQVVSVRTSAACSAPTWRAGMLRGRACPSRHVRFDTKRRMRDGRNMVLQAGRWTAGARPGCGSGAQRRMRDGETWCCRPDDGRRGPDRGVAPVHSGGCATGETWPPPRARNRASTGGSEPPSSTSEIGSGRGSVRADGRRPRSRRRLRLLAGWGAPRRRVRGTGTTSHAACATPPRGPLILPGWPGGSGRLGPARSRADRPCRFASCLVSDTRCRQSTVRAADRGRSVVRSCRFGHRPPALHQPGAPGCSAGAPARPAMSDSIQSGGCATAKHGRREDGTVRVRDWARRGSVGAGCSGRPQPPRRQDARSGQGAGSD